MKIAATFILTAVAILAVSFLLLSVLGVSLGVRVGGNLFADESLGSVSPAHLVLLTLAAMSGLYLLWRGRRRSR
jgi:membrane protein DedA with SNARE-associated domain